MRKTRLPNCDGMAPVKLFSSILLQSKITTYKNLNMIEGKSEKVVSLSIKKRQTIWLNFQEPQFQ